MGRGLIGREGHGLAQELDGFVVLMLVDERGRSSAQRIGRLGFGPGLWGGRRGTRPQEHRRHARGQ